MGRHAEAATCRVSLFRRPEGAVLEIDDDGRGFDVDDATSGMGLSNLRDRVDAMGGSFDISSVLGDGTTVRIVLPL